MGAAAILLVFTPFPIYGTLTASLFENPWLTLRLACHHCWGAALKTGPTVFYHLLPLNCRHASNFNSHSCSLIWIKDRPRSSKLETTCQLSIMLVDAYQYGFFFPHLGRSHSTFICPRLQQPQRTGKLACYRFSHPFLSGMARDVN